MTAEKIERYIDKPGRPFGGGPTEEHPYQVRVRVIHETRFTPNALTFETAQDARDYAADLAWRWLAVEEYRIVNALTGEEVYT